MAVESAFDVMNAMLREWGLESLAPQVRRMLVDGRTAEQVSVLLQDTEEYKKRFAGNELRRQQGLAVLSPRDYLETELAYRQIMENAGLPQGFYDSREDFAQWIGAGVAPVEIKGRIDAALDAAEQMLDRDTAGAFRDYFGFDSLPLAAAFALDRTRGQQQVERAFRSGLLGGAARGQGLQMDQGRAEQLAAAGIVDASRYREAAGQVARMTAGVGRLSGIHSATTGATYGQTEAEQQVFMSDEDARRRQRRLAQAERAEFDAGSGASPIGLARAPGAV